MIVSAESSGCKVSPEIFSKKVDYYIFLAGNHIMSNCQKVGRWTRPSVFRVKIVDCTRNA
jgi:hypothetical protein